MKKIDPNEKILSVTFGFYARNGYYSSPSAFEEVDRMAEANVNWVTLIVTVMQEGFAATRQFRDFVNTPNDIEIAAIIDYIHKKGMKVQLRPMLECFDGKGRLGVTFPADSERIPGLHCNYASRWFTSMKQRSVYYAHIAELCGCEMFCLDSELDHIIGFHTEWKEIIAAVRAVYSGTVTSCHTIHTQVIDFERELKKKDHWFFDLDLLSISDYYSCADKPGLTAEEMTDNFSSEREKLARIAALYGKPILLGECGCTSSSGGAMHPSSWGSTAAYDGNEQANYLEALLAAYKNEPWWQGMVWWKWDEQNDRPNFRNDPAGDKGFIVRGKPAEDVMRCRFAEILAK